MTRQTIDVGIDLGTTNSCIAVMGPDGPELVRNEERIEFTPSAVAMRRSGEIYVGRRAKERVEDDTENAAAEFKRLMGIAGQAKTFAASGRVLTPPELSAEVLKALRGDVVTWRGEQIDAAVITIPAAFNIHQSKATIEAASLAGLRTSMLLQEPTAAAYAWSRTRVSDRGFWLVYDLGGGTFDAALLKLDDGESALVNHAGDNHLGGTRIDWDIVDRLLMPAAAAEYPFPGFRREDGMDPRWRGAVATLKGAAEEAKVALSGRESKTIEVPLRDLDGREHRFEFTLTRGQLDAIAMPYYRRSVELSRKALAEAGIGPGDVERVLLVGGSTISPTLRALLADPDEGLGIELDTTLDPITVVAQGAALFAAGQLLSAPPPGIPAPGEFRIELRYNPHSDDPEPLIGGTLHGPPGLDRTGFSVRFSDPDEARPWTGPWVPLTAEGAFAAEVLARRNTLVEFRIEVRDPTGTLLPVTPAVATYRHGDSVPDSSPVLTGSVGAGLVGDHVLWFARKGQSLGRPISETRVLRSTEAVDRRAGTGAITVPIVQGERPRADRNTAVGTISVTPADVRRDVPVGSEVELTIEIDQTRGITTTAFLPLTDQFWEATYTWPSLPDAAELREQVEIAGQRLEDLRRRADAAVEAEPRDILRKIESGDGYDELQRLATTVAVAADDAPVLANRLEEFNAGLDELEDALELPELESRVAQAREGVVELIEHTGDSRGRAALAEIDAEVARAVAGRDGPALRRQADTLNQVAAETLGRNDLFETAYFNQLCGMRDAMTDVRRADSLIASGRAALARRDDRTLAGINDQLNALLPQELRQRKSGGGNTESAG